MYKRQELRSNIKWVEPILRDARYLHFDIDSLRQNESLCTRSLPSGMTTEEACQLFRFAGESQLLKCITINLEGCDQGIERSSMIIAECLWYFFEGQSLRTDDHPTTSDNFSKYLVELNDINSSLTFYRHKSSHKWWMHSPSQNTFVACSEEEYNSTIKEEIPLRLLNKL